MYRNFKGGPHDPHALQDPVRAAGDRRSRRKGQAKAKAMMNPDDVHKILLICTLGLALICGGFFVKILHAFAHDFHWGLQ